jgi:two-component system LytT family response regulator
MTNYKAIIIEDEANAAKMLDMMLIEIEPGLHVVDMCEDIPCGVKSIKKHDPDIVFLDIDLPVYRGLQLLEFFNPEEITFQLIFTTAYNEYALKAFEMSAVDYLLKPIQEPALRKAIQKAQKISDSTINRLSILKENFKDHSQNKKIVVPVADGFEIVATMDICYIKAEGSYSNIFFTSCKTMLVSKNLKYFEFLLSGTSSFMRIHRSYLVNLNHVKKLNRNDGGILQLNNKTELPISEEKLDALVEALRRI